MPYVTHTSDAGVTVRGPVEIRGVERGWNLAGDDGAAEPRADSVMTTVACQGDPVLTAVETATTITLTLISTEVLEGPELMCARITTVELDAPVGDRTIIDAFTGEAVPDIRGFD
ncbi:hypothetical protein [Demequina silvatica]|uniref:hypothetical protein n=1 Tax=Demequina silvatica TaxID=1638988 RepID=UPI0007866B2D|nr:hypothetical protein [Demequina silvatica]